MNKLMIYFLVAISTSVFAQNGQPSRPNPLFLSNASKLSHSGGMGNGGHPVEMEFIRIGRELTQELSELSIVVDDLRQINVTKFASDIEGATIEIITDVSDRDRETCLENDADTGVIRLNLRCWEQISRNKKVARAFVLKAFLDLDPKMSRFSDSLASLYYKITTRN